MFVDKKRFRGSIGVAEWFHNLCALRFDILRSSSELHKNQLVHHKHIYCHLFFNTISYILHKLFSWAIRLDLHFSFDDERIWAFIPLTPSHTVRLVVITVEVRVTTVLQIVWKPPSAKVFSTVCVFFIYCWKLGVVIANKRIVGISFK